ncbi:ribosomal protein L28e [Eremomyces bilateralis CBS 781.70]|uniref:Ribosomal protein L28e n=1 Tax=Eremomyces bilateralis CBS 781.70 TaxID=1392243 RepID=A0A6G1G1M0_9PEZI|nr:ribosomal protein L28e [Eremomyces bilateralis CBS 781.70]KAF1812007.1 ribosomal protein L28e [Eremomyces bilateralis CBS 781.70]
MSLSTDLLWEVTRNNSAFLVNRRTGGGARFSRDPLNLTNVYSRKYEGSINEKAFGVQPAAEGGVEVSVKKAGKANKPASALQTSTIGKGKSTRKTYQSIVNSTTKRHYRPDLRAEAVARASAIRQSQRPKKATPERKLRGRKAEKAAEVEA